MTFPETKKSSKQIGASLLEVLIALFILGVGLLGVLAMQAESFKYNQQSYGSTQALFMANDAVERMRTNLLTLTKEQQATPTKAQVFPDADLNEWKANVSQSVPGGVGTVDPVGSSFKVTITYPQQVLANENKTVDGDSEDVTYVLFTSL
ncbi:MAG TPA: type IV pilus modification protein PilV [Marinagarivorans sp.]